MPEKTIGPGLLKRVTKGVQNFFKADVAGDSGGNKKAIAIANPYSMFSAGGTQAVSDPVKGLKKPSNISFANLRKIARYDSLIRICINVIKKEVSQSEWDIIPTKEHKDDFNPKHIDEVKMLFTLVNQNGENLRLLLDRIVEDLLTLDAACIEKVYNAKDELVELNSVDGATIRPVYNIHGELDPSKSYVQIINDKVVAKFANTEMIYMMQNPQNDIYLFGYGLSPIESILLTVQASLNADVYNSELFSKDNIPPGVLDLGDMTGDEAKQFIAIWNATVVNNTQKMKFVWGNNNAKKYTSFQSPNKDMQYIEYIDWLSRIKLSAYGLSTLDANITQDVNRATAETQEAITKSRGVKSVKKLVEEYFNREIVLSAGYMDVEFKFNEATNLKEKKTQAEIDKIYIETGVYLPSDVAKREGIENYDEDDDESMLDGGASPNPKDGETAQAVSDKETIVEDGLNPNNTTQEKSVRKKKGTHFKPLY